MKKRNIEEMLKREAREHVPDVSVDLGPSVPEQVPQGEAVLAKPKARTVIVLLSALLALLLVAAALLPLLLSRAGGGDFGTIVISINPTAEFTVEDGKITGTRPLNRDAAVLLVGKDFTGQTAEEACVGFAQLAGERNLITADGIRVRVSGKNSAHLLHAVNDALGAKFSVGEFDDAAFDALMQGYDESAMHDFEDYLIGAYEGQREEYLRSARALLESYAKDLSELSPSDMGAIDAFNRKYLLLGEDFLIETDDDDPWAEIVEDLMEEYEEITGLLARNPEKAFEELFDGFTDVLEEEYDRRGGTDRDNDDDDDDDDHDDDDDDDDDDD